MDIEHRAQDIDYLDLASRSPTLLNELHHLFWISPRTNRGKFDGGWSCREHSLALAALALLSGRSVHACHGRAAYVCGPESGKPPVGWEIEPHTWVHIDGLGGCDLSVRLGVGITAERWPRAQETHLFGGRFIPEGTATYLSTPSAEKFQAAYASATHQDGHFAALYNPRAVEPITWTTIRDAQRWIDSPLTVQLKRRFPGKRDLYERAFLHLAALLREEAESLTGCHPHAAWRTLATA